MMPALHNYITVDPQAFLALPLGMGMIFNMCKRVNGWDIAKICPKLKRNVVFSGFERGRWRRRSVSRWKTFGSFGFAISRKN